MQDQWELTFYHLKSETHYTAQFATQPEAFRMARALAGFHSGDRVRALITQAVAPHIDPQGNLITGILYVSSYEGQADSLHMRDNWASRSLRIV